jgi:hypothetical protein
VATTRMMVSLDVPRHVWRQRLVIGEGGPAASPRMRVAVASRWQESIPKRRNEGEKREETGG